MKIFRIIRLYIFYILKYLIFLFFYPLVIFINKIKKYKFIKFAEVRMDRIGHIGYEVEGHLVGKKISDELNNCKIIYFFGLYICNKQIEKMVRRILPISHKLFSLFFLLLYKSLKFWKKNEHILDFTNFSIYDGPAIISISKRYNKFEYNKTNLHFTKDEKKKGFELIKKLGLNEGDKWICFHNRDSYYLRKKYPNREWSYHDYRNFSVSSLKSAAEFFASKGFFVVRMGAHQSEKLKTNNPKIIDYANSSFKNDFLDMYLLANSKFY